MFGAMGSITFISDNNTWVFDLDGNSNTLCIKLSTLYGYGNVASVLAIAVTTHDESTFVTPPLYLPNQIKFDYVIWPIYFLYTCKFVTWYSCNAYVHLLPSLLTHAY